MKKYFLLMVSLSLFAAEDKNCICNTYEFSTAEKVVIYGLLGTGVVGGTIIAAPFVLPASTIAAIQAASVTAATSVATYSSAVIVPKTTIGAIGMGLSVGQWARPYILQTTEESLNVLLKERSERPTKAKKEFISCLKANKANSQRNASGRPIACEDEALFYAFNSSVSELNKKTEAFKNGKCFCS